MIIIVLVILRECIGWAIKQEQGDSHGGQVVVVIRGEGVESGVV
jgi:hypothetical protein